MKLLRFAIAVAAIRMTMRFAVAIAPEIKKPPARINSTGARSIHPVERLLLASIVGLGIAGLWIMIAARASL